MRADLLAGAAVSCLLIPQAMAYAQLAGLPAYYGLYAAFVPTIVGALFGSCPQLATGPVAMTSLICLTVLADPRLGSAGTQHYAQMAFALACLAGLIRIVLGLLGCAGIVNILPYPVILGFTNAGALIIAASQLSKFLGLPTPNTGVFVFDILLVLADVLRSNPMAIMFGVLPLIVILGLARVNKRWPAVLLAVALCTILSWLLDYATAWRGSVVGFIPAGLPLPSVPRLTWSSLINLLPGAIVVVIVGLMETAAVSKALSAKTRKPLDLNQEFIGQGMANLAGSFTQSYPVSGSFSRSALNYYAGAITGMSSVFAGILVLITILFLTPLFHHLPQATLAGIVILAVLNLVDFRALFALRSVNTHDSMSAWLTFSATLIMAPRIVEGILIGALLSVGYAFYRLSNPHVALLGRHPDGSLRDADRHQLPTDDDVVTLRFEGRLCFANASSFEDAVLAVLNRQPRPSAILVHSSGINEIDASGVDRIRHIHGLLRERGVILAFSELKWKPLEVLERTGLARDIGSENIFRTSDLGATALKARSLEMRAAAAKFAESAPQNP